MDRNEALEQHPTFDWLMQKADERGMAYGKQFLIEAKKAWERRMNEFQAKIIKAFADNSMNVSSTARELQYHRNSIMYHFEKIHDKTGLDPRDFYDLVKLLRMVGEDV